MNIKKELSEIAIPSSLDNITDRAVKHAVSKRAARVRERRYIAVFAVTVFVFLGGITVVQPVWAKEIPFLNSIFEYINENLLVSGDYGKYAAEVQRISEDNGVEIEMSEIYCDGENLFISYVVHSKQSFSSYVKGEYHQSQMLTEGINLTVKSNGSERTLDTTGYGESMTGKFVDDHTFLGAAYYMDENEVFPDSFSLGVTIPSLKLQDVGKKPDYLIPGVWNFNVPVKVNHEDIQEIAPNVSNRGHSIDRVVISPFLVTINTSYPDIYFQREGIDYLVKCFSDKSSQPISFDGIAEKTTAFSKLSRSDIEGSLRIYIVDAKDMEKEGVDENSETDIEKYAIVHTTITLSSPETLTGSGKVSPIK